MVEFRQILCPFDFSDQSRHALSYAVGIAALFGGRITVLQVGFAGVTLPGRASSLDPSQRIVWANGEEGVVGHVTRVGCEDAARTVRVRLRVTSRRSADAVLDVAASLGADLIVVGTRNASAVRRALPTSLAYRIVSKATFPVLAVPPPSPIRTVTPRSGFARVLCAVDFWGASMQALDCAASLAERSGAALLVIHVEERSERSTACRKLRADCADTLPEASLRRLSAAIPSGARAQAAVHASAVHGRPYREILRVAEAEFADLIVLGQQAPALNRPSFRSSAGQVLRRARCPVLVAPSRRA